MNCISPPALTDDQISAVLDGEADTSVIQHLERCPACLARFQRVAQFEKSIARALFRIDCPSPQRITDYHFDFLSQEAATEIAAHLETCVRCQEEMRTLQAFVGDDPPIVVAAPKRPRGRRKRVRLGELIGHLTSPQPTLALRGGTLRGASSSLMFEANGTTIFIESEETATGPVLSGQVIASKHMSFERAVIELYKAGSIESKAFIEQDGIFRLERLPTGPIELRITSDTGWYIVLKGIELIE